MAMQRTMLRHIPRLIRHGNPRLLTSLSTVTQPTIEHLRRYGYAVQDDVLGSCEIRSLRGEIDSLITRGLATANKTHVISARGTRTYEKGAVLQSELQTLSRGVLDTIPGLHELHTDASLAALISVFFPRMTLREQFVKVQRASSGVGCFPIHVDSSPMHDSRLVTGLLYVHEELGDGDGGELRIYDTPMSYVDIKARPGRLVLLSSCSMHHRVLRCSKERYAITIWLSGSLREQAGEKVGGCLETRVGYEMLSRELRDAGVRLVRGEEWKRSLRESHEGKISEEVVREFEESVDGIRRIVPGVLCGRHGFEDVEKKEVEKIVENEERLKRGFVKVGDLFDGMPFLW